MIYDRKRKRYLLGVTECVWGGIRDHEWMDGSADSGHLCLNAFTRTFRFSTEMWNGYHSFSYASHQSIGNNRDT